MITAGVDLGIETVKVVVLKDGEVVAKGIARSGGSERASSADQVWNEVLKSAGLSPSDVSNVIATGQGKWDVRFANDYVVETVADARAAPMLFPSARSVVDIGADQARAIICDESGKTVDIVLNQKCTAGIGTFYRSMARTLGITLDEMSGLSSNSNNVSVNDGCAVFAELDAIWLAHNNTPKKDIVQAINEAMATRLNSMLNEKITLEKDVMLIGGLARNTGVVNALKERSGFDFLIPEEPEYAGALGAALIAAS